jgi:transposase
MSERKNSGRAQQVAVADPAMAYCGIDVSAKTLAAAVRRAGRDGFEQRGFANTAAGHKQLIAWLKTCGDRARVTLEATGSYSLQLSLALDAAASIELAVLNPKDMHEYAKSRHRSKTDKADALALADYCLRQEFFAWRRPSPLALELRVISRHINDMTEQNTRLRNQLHAAESAGCAPRCVLKDMKNAIAAVAKRLLAMRREAVVLIQADPGLKRKFAHLIGVKGIAETSAVALLGELAALDDGMTVRQWVAMSGLDPAHHDSGSSVHKRAVISRHGNRNLRRALYMPALSASRFDPHLRTFYRQLQDRHKAKRQALMAVARKLLHAIFGMFKTNTPYDGARLFPAQIHATAQI